MKYFIFALALSGVIPAAFIAAMEKRFMRIAAFFAVFSAIAFDQGSINFFSHELYRGTSRGVEVSAAYLATAVLLLATIIRVNRLKVFPDWGVLFYFLYFISGILSMSNAENLLFSVFELWKMVMMYLIFLSVWNYVYNTGDYDIFLWGIGCLIFLNFFVILKDKYLFGIYQARGVFAHQNSMSMYMSLAGMVFLSGLMNLRDKKKVWCFAVFFILAGASAFLSYSRGAMFCFPFGMSITAGLSLCYGFNMRKMAILSVLGMIGIIGLILILPRILQRFETAPEASKNTRVAFAIAAFNMMNDKALGIGINNWGIKINPPHQYSEHRDPSKGFTEDYKDGIVETIYLLVGAECGYYALGILLCWLGYYYFAAWRLLKKLAGTEHFFIAAGLCGGLSAIYLQSTLEWVLKQPINFSELMVFFAIISVLLRVYSKKAVRSC